MNIDDATLATQYIKVQEGKCHNEDVETAHEHLNDLVRTDTPRALKIIDLIINGTEDQQILSYVGAGPLEDILTSKAGINYVDEIIVRARQNKNWRFALGNVWINSSKDKSVQNIVEVNLNIFFPNSRP